MTIKFINAPNAVVLKKKVTMLQNSQGYELGWCLNQGFLPSNNYIYNILIVGAF